MFGTFVNLILIKYRDDDHAAYERGSELYGNHHIGFEVDDINSATKKIKSLALCFTVNGQMRKT